MPSTKKSNPTNKPKTAKKPESVSKSNTKSKAAPKRNPQNLIFGKPPKFWGRIALVTLAVVLPVMLVFDITIGGNLRMYAKWMECGQKPVVAMNRGWGFIDNYKGSGLSRVRHYAEPYNYALIQPLRLYCTPHEAEMHGFSASKDGYKFDHLTQEEHNAVYDKYLKP